MIKSDKTKIKPRDLFLVQSLVNKNGSLWAELFKFGSKLVNKPHLVKLEDLVKVPSRPQRKAALQAREKIKQIIPAIRKILHENVPTHSWSYDHLMHMFMQDDLLYKTSKDGLMINEEMKDDDGSCEEMKDDGESCDITMTPLCTTAGDDMKYSEEAVVQSSSRVFTPEVDCGYGDNASLLERVVDLQEMLDNPSIQVYPQHYSQVNLHAVQNMSQVFDDLYNVEDKGRRRSVRLSERPKRDFSQYR